MGTFAIVDVGIGNLRSVQKAIAHAADLARVPCEVSIVSDPDVVARADRVILPGQGAFRDCASALTGAMAEAVRAQVAKGTPYLGICLGLQVLFESSEEAPGCVGLGIFPGTNARLPDNQHDPVTGEALKIPHMGWNELTLKNGGHPFLRAAGGDGTYAYFTHSFHAVPKDERLVVATVKHGPLEITAAVARDNVFATQFHPEKSQAAGIALLDAFVKS